MVSLSKRWAAEGVPRDVVIGSLAAIVAGAGDHAPIAELFAALEVAPLVDITAFEILLRILENRPEFVPGVRYGRVVVHGGEVPEIEVDVGRLTTLELIPGTRAETCSLLGGNAPPHDVVVNRAPPSCKIRIDARGTWLFGIVASRTPDDGVRVLGLVTVHAR